VTNRIDWRASRLNRLKVAAIAAVVRPAIGLLGRTYRWRVEGLEWLGQVEASGRLPILAFWHGRILPATYYFRSRGIVVITSENFDGEWIARVIERFGYGTARGSTSRGARRALLQLKKQMGGGRAVGFTVDGPRGPARRVQPGAVWLSRATGNPVVPFHIEAMRHWSARSWDKTQVPAPFTTLALAIGSPIQVPGDADPRELEDRRVEVELALTALELRAERLLRGGTA
jgi:lysophospholipid acyltransferase (LPLAT)-like uncharacterized protein